MDEIVIEGFPKNRTTVVVGLLNEHNGRLLVHVREMNASVTEAGWVHGRGVALEVDRIWELLDAVKRLEDVAAPDRVVGKIPVGRDQIRIGVQSWRGDLYAYVRRFYPDGDDFKPTQQGVNIKTHLIEDLIALVDRTGEAAVEAGLVERRKD